MECRLWNIWKSALCLRSVSPVPTGNPVLHAASRSGAVTNVVTCWRALSRFASHQKMNRPVLMCREVDISLVCEPPGADAPGG